MKAFSNISLFIVATLLSSMTYASIIGLPTEGKDSEITVESIGDSANPKIKMTFSGVTSCQPNIQFYIDGMSKLDGSPVLYGEVSDERITFAVTQDGQCTFGALFSSLDPKKADKNQKAIEFAKIEKIIDINEELFSAQYFNDSAIALIKKLYNTNQMVLSITIQTIDKSRSATDTVFKYINFSAEDTASSKIIYSTK